MTTFVTTVKTRLVAADLSGHITAKKNIIKTCTQTENTGIGTGTLTLDI